MAKRAPVTLFLPLDVRAEIDAERERQNRKASWLVQQAWRIARDRLATYTEPVKGSWVNGLEEAS